MCWISNNTPIRQIASDDIKVKKILLKVKVHQKDGHDKCEVSSPCYTQKWDSGKCVQSELEHTYKSISHNQHVINIGLHSCKEVVVMRDNIFYNSIESFYATNDGKECQRLWQVGKNMFVCNAIIPKGSTYYVNEYGEYVSDKLICNFDI